MSENKHHKTKAQTAMPEDEHRTMLHSARTAFKTYVEPAFRRPEFVQTGALCVRQGQKGLEVLLISSLTSKRWIVPKGWPMKGRTLAGAALQEAWEEAGVKGAVAETAMGSFTYRKTVKRGIPVQCRCDLFRVDVTDLADDWPEKGLRKREWLSPAKAAERVEEPELQQLLRSL